MSKNVLSNISQADSEALEHTVDESIDCSEIPQLTEAFFKNAALRIPPSQIARWLKVDLEVLEWFQNHSSDPKQSMNEVLRDYVTHQTP